MFFMFKYSKVFLIFILRKLNNIKEKKIYKFIVLKFIWTGVNSLNRFNSDFIIVKTLR